MRNYKLNTRAVWVAVGALLYPVIALSQSAGQWHDPKTLFSKTCAYCHDQGLVKGVGPEILARQLPAQAIAYFVRHGKGAMPAFPESQISPKELEQLGVWIQESKVASDKGTGHDH